MVELPDHMIFALHVSAGKVIISATIPERPPSSNSFVLISGTKSSHSTLSAWETEKGRKGMLTSSRKKKASATELIGPGTLTVSVREARLLASEETSCDPFCKIYCDVSSQSFVTRTKRGTTSPLWEEDFMIYIGDLQPTQEIYIKVYSRAAAKLELLGHVKVKLRALSEAPGDTIENWYNLEKEPDINKAVPAQLRLRFHYPKDVKLVNRYRCEEPTKYYTFGHELGQGAFGVVRLCVHKATKKEYAIKIITKQKMNKRQQELLEREIAVMSKLHHPNIVNLEEAFDTPEYTYLVIEYVDGGSMLKELMDKGPYSDREASRFVRLLLESIAYMNSRGVAHRDLKPDNLLVTRDRVLKVSDFGLSKDMTQGALQTSVGTACYVAPEVVSGKKYSTACDVWSVGVIAYIFLSAQMPFYGSNNPEIFDKIRTADYTFPSPYFDNVSVDAMDFIDKILVPNVRQRMTLETCLEHPWIKKWNPDIASPVSAASGEKSSSEKRKKKRGSSRRDDYVSQDRSRFEKPVDPNAADQPQRAATNTFDEDENDGFPPLGPQFSYPPIREPPPEEAPPLPSIPPPDEVQVVIEGEPSADKKDRKHISRRSRSKSKGAECSSTSRDDRVASSGGERKRRSKPKINYEQDK